ncbi:hypothetical protein DSOL_4060 [Desulfosporosinus metallidurans]|uniref:Uncharacterized protein n=2 Tax=Desulfosporosinus metallidurans TaxID=1888891 RepID=A0A1Q8QM44_9FIRM|nr:hypothetical protein DSOL_4060 [Desulfosporosinus metallidurans]
MWQADFQHTLYLPDPLNPKKRKKAMLFAIIDDYPRAIGLLAKMFQSKLIGRHDVRLS